MNNSLTEVNSWWFDSFDGTRLHVQEMGEGRPLILLHGLFSNADVNWIKYGTAGLLARAGFRLVMPDLRTHGASAAPHEAEAYPPAVLVRDLCALVEGLALAEYDLCGFSLGARTALSGVVSGLSPRRLVLAGMGLEGLSGWQARSAFFIDAIERFDTVKRGDPAFMAVQFMKTMKVDRVAVRLLLESVGDIAPGDLARIARPVLVLCGEDDRDNGSPEALAKALPDARMASIPGTHMSSVTEPALGRAIAQFLLE